jgi:hypothetical protein
MSSFLLVVEHTVDKPKQMFAGKRSAPSPPFMQKDEKGGAPSLFILPANQPVHICHDAANKTSVYRQRNFLVE